MTFSKQKISSPQRDHCGLSDHKKDVAATYSDNVELCDQPVLGLVSEPNSSFYSKEQNGFDFQNSQKNFYRPDGHKVGNGLTVLMTVKALISACVTDVQRKTPLFLNAVIEEARGAN